jgi:predicted permease
MYVVPNLEGSLLAAGHVWNVLLSLVYPFSTGIAVAGSVSTVTLSLLASASAALVVYGLLAVYVGKWSLSTVRRVSQGAGLNVSRLRAHDFRLKQRGPMLGYVVKDLKAASRNPATAFFFALPVLEAVIVTLLDSNLGNLRAALLLTSASMGGVFALFLPLALLSAEGKGLEYTKTLPIDPRRIIIPKALIATATYVPVPVALAALSLFKPLTSPVSILIPFLIVLSVASASIFEIKLFLRAASRSRIASVVNDFEKLVLGIFVILAPVLIYAATFLATFNHGFSLLAMSAVALTEFFAAYRSLSR